MSPAGSSRWTPTTEQLMILEELYRSGIRTPSASQIQQITTHLSLYGRIEGKNVFYWFQNHKARDRQKLRRKLNRQLQLQQQHQLQLHHHHYQQLSNQDVMIGNHFVGGFGGHIPPPSSAVAKEISFYGAPGLFLRGGDANASERATSCKWSTVYNPQSSAEKEAMEFCGNDYGCTTTTTTTRVPLKTLDLFPITTSRIKED